MWAIIIPILWIINTGSALHPPTYTHTAGEPVSWAENAVCPSTDHNLLMRSLIISSQLADHSMLGAPHIFAKQCLRDFFILKNECACCHCLVSHVRLCATPWPVAQQAPVSMGIFQARILEWVVISSSRDLPDPGIEPQSPALLADSLPMSHPPRCPYPGHVHYPVYHHTRLSQETKEL